MKDGIRLWKAMRSKQRKQVKYRNQENLPQQGSSLLNQKFCNLYQYSNTRKKTNVQQRSMTFKKLLKEAAKVDPSTFKFGPKVKPLPRVPEKPRPVALIPRMKPVPGPIAKH